MKCEIKSRWNGSVLFSMECAILRVCVEAAVRSGADLSWANLSGADLSGADLSRANLSRADLSGADLSRADLSRAIIDRKYLPPFQIPQTGPLHVFKALKNGIIAELLIPADAKRTASVVGRKCRAEYVQTLSLSDGDVGYAQHDGKTEFRVGEITRPDSYDDNPLVECTTGIHFFLTREEAEQWL